MAKTLTVRVDDQDHIYDLHGQDFDVSFTPGYYEQIRLYKQDANIWLILCRSKSAAIPTAPQPVRPTAVPQVQVQPAPTQVRRAVQPTPVPQRCSIEVHPKFQQVWKRAGGVSAGCPLGSAYEKRSAYQSFQNGLMLWHAGPHSDAGGMIYVVYNSGHWEAHRDEWGQGMQKHGNYTPPAGLVEPKRGFGYLWRTKLGGPNATIGWALADEVGSEHGLIQDFANNAAIFRYPGQPPVFMPYRQRWVK